MKRGIYLEERLLKKKSNKELEFNIIAMEMYISVNEIVIYIMEKDVILEYQG
jgi:hypothetical protein